MSKRKGIIFNIVILALLPVLMIFCICIGKYPVSAIESLQIIWGNIIGLTGNWPEMTQSVVIGLILPRVLATVMVGGCLSIAGAAFQGIFKNPLVSPDFLGVSAGATVGAGIAILLSFSSIFVSLFAFVGGLIAVVLTISIPRLMKSSSNIMLVLSGIIVGGLMSSVFGFIKYVADPETQLATITYWQMGDFSYIDMPTLLVIIPIIIIPVLVILGMSWWIDVLSLGENEAQSLGVNVAFIRTIIITMATLMTAASVCIAGTIGWVGLVIPHFARLLIGPNNTRLMPLSFLLGGAFLLIVDTLTRSITAVEMPISILTGIVGAPFYAWLLYRQRAKVS